MYNSIYIVCEKKELKEIFPCIEKVCSRDICNYKGKQKKGMSKKQLESKEFPHTKPLKVNKRRKIMNILNITSYKYIFAKTIIFQTYNPYHNTKNSITCNPKINFFKYY